MEHGASRYRFICHSLKTRWGQGMATSEATKGVVLLVLLGVLAGFPPASVDMALPALPRIGDDLAAADQVTQWTITVFLVGMCLGMVFHGPLSDSFGRRPVLLWGIGLYIVSSLACALVDGIALLIGARFFQALGAGAASVMARVVVRDVYSAADSPRILSQISLVTSIAPLLAPSIGAVLMLLLGWRSIFLTLTVFGLVCLVAAWRIIPETLSIPSRGTGSFGRAMMAYGKIFRTREAVGHLLCGGGVFAAMFAYVTGTPFVYIEYFDLDPIIYGALFAANICVQALGSFLNSRLVGRHGIGVMNGVAVLLAGAGGVGLLLAGMGGMGLALILLSLFPIIGVTTLLGANCTARLMALFPANAGAAAASLVITMFGLGGLASLLVSLLHDGTPLAMCLVVFMCVLLAVGGQFALARSR